MMDEGDSDYETEAVDNRDKGKGRADDADEYDPLIQSAGRDSSRPEALEDVASITADVQEYSAEHVGGSLVTTPPPAKPLVDEEDLTTEEKLKQAVADSLGEDDGAMHDPAARAQQAAVFARTCAAEVASMEYSVSVTNPIMHDDPLIPFVTYDVTSKHGTVARRFNEFVWLHDMLLDMCPGIIVPRLPEKQAMGRFEQDFVERRRVELERFLRRVAAHPDMARSGPFLEFCTTATPLAGADSSPGMATEAVTKILATLGNALALNEGVATNRGDIWFTDKAQQVEALAACLNNALKAMASAYTNMKEMGRAQEQLATSLRASAAAENNEPLSTAMCNVADLSDRTASLSRDTGSDYLEALAVVVREYMGLAQSLVQLFNKRAALVDDVYATKSNLARAQSLAQKRFDGPDAEDRRLQAEREAQQSQEYNEKLRHQLSELSSTLRKECARFDVERPRDLAAAIMAFVKAAVSHQEQVVRLYEDASKKLLVANTSQTEARRIQSE